VNSVYHTKPTRDGDCSEEEQKKGFDRTGSPLISHPDSIDSGGDKLVRTDQVCVILIDHNLK
jgi:hypothetical protein